MKVLVLGGTGMAGHTVSIYFKEAGHEVTVFARKKVNYCEFIKGNVTDFNFLRDIIEKGKYDVVINAVGILNYDAETNKAAAVLLNSYLPHFLCEITKCMKTKIIHMSTDCVFSGKKGGYIETSLKDGESFYDRSKALGEIENAKNLTFRNSIIGPDMKQEGIGLFNWFMKQEGQIEGFNKAIWTGVTTITLAKAMEQAIKEEITGVYNLVNDKTISKYELLKLLNIHIKDKSIDIFPNEKIMIDKSLINTRTDFSFKVPSYEKMIIEMKEWIEKHKEIYPHYFN